MRVAIAGKTREIEPCEERGYSWRIDGKTLTNDAGLLLLFQQWRADADMTEAQRERRKQECIYDLGFRCPYGRPICQSGKRHKGLVDIQVSNYTVTWEPVGQMSLFEPEKTHRPVWVNGRQRIEQPEQPYTSICVMCDQMARAGIEVMRRKFPGHYPGPDWRITPLDAQPVRRVPKLQYKPCLL